MNSEKTLRLVQRHVTSGSINDRVVIMSTTYFEDKREKVIAIANAFFCIL